MTPWTNFGRDHWSTFGYIAYCCVNKDGIPEREKMRVDVGRHPFLGHAVNRAFPDKRYPTRLRDGSELAEHDDYDCADDLEEVGLIVHIGSGVNPRWRLTERGFRVWDEVQRAQAARPRIGWSEFCPSDDAMAAAAMVPAAKGEERTDG